RPGAERNADPGVVAGGGAAGRAATPGGTRPSARGTERPGAGSRVSTRARGVGRHGAGGALGHDAARAALRPPRPWRPGGERLPAARDVARGGAPGLEARAPPPGRGTRRGGPRAALVRGRERPRDPAPPGRSGVVGPRRPATSPGG